MPRNVTIRISKEGDSLWILAMAWSQDGRTLALLDAYRYAWLADIPRPNRAARIARFDGGVLGSLAWSPDGSRLAGGGDPLENASETDCTIRIWDIGADRQTGILAGHAGRVTCLTWLPDGERLVSGSADRTVGLWAQPPDAA